MASSDFLRSVISVLMPYQVIEPSSFLFGIEYPSSQISPLVGCRYGYSLRQGCKLCAEVPTASIKIPV